MKRFTHVEKWDDPWFWELSPLAKLLWLFLCDHCDSAGVVDVSLKIASAKVGQTIQEKHLAELQSRLHTLENGKRLIRSFIRFQYGSLRPECKPHAAVIATLARHGIDLAQLDLICKQYPNPLDTLSGVSQTPQDQDKDQDQDQEKDQDKDPEGSAEGNQFPAVLNTPAFRSAWDQWVAHRTEIKKKLTPTSVGQQMKQLAAMGESRAITTIQYTIAKGWQGLVEPNETYQRNSTASHRPVTGAQQRQTGIPERPRENLSRLIAGQRPANGVATPPPAPSGDQSGSPTHG